jgi:hypothetical protein
MMGTIRENRLERIEQYVDKDCVFLLFFWHSLLGLWAFSVDGVACSSSDNNSCVRLADPQAFCARGESGETALRGLDRHRPVFSLQRHRVFVLLFNRFAGSSNRTDKTEASRHRLGMNRKQVREAQLRPSA